jgi:hypothetical protein
MQMNETKNKMTLKNSFHKKRLPSPATAPKTCSPLSTYKKIKYIKMMVLSVPLI